MRKEGRHVKIVVSLDEDLSQEARARHFLIGCIGVSGKTKWDVLDGVVRRLFKVNNLNELLNLRIKVSFILFIFPISK